MSTLINGVQYFSTKEVAARMGVHPATIRRWEHEGRTPRPMVRNGRRLYTEDDLQRIGTVGVVEAESWDNR